MSPWKALTTRFVLYHLSFTFTSHVKRHTNGNEPCSRRTKEPEMQLRKQPCQTPHGLTLLHLNKATQMSYLFTPQKQRWVISLCYTDGCVSVCRRRGAWMSRSLSYWESLREAESCLHGLLSPACETKSQNTPTQSAMHRVSRAARTSLPWKLQARNKHHRLTPRGVKDCYSELKMPLDLLPLPGSTKYSTNKGKCYLLSVHCMCSFF